MANKGDEKMILSEVRQHPLALPVAQPKRPGRKKKLFSPDWDASTGRLGWFVGYCSCGCSGKAILPWAMMEELKVQASKRQRSLTYRLLTKMLKHYEH